MRRAGARLPGAPASPQVRAMSDGDIGVAVFESGMRRHDDAGFLGPRPEGVEGTDRPGTATPRG